MLISSYSMVMCVDLPTAGIIARRDSAVMRSPGMRNYYLKGKKPFMTLI
jgi:hypothetical protein